MAILSSIMRKKLLILIGGHLATAPRPQKEAAAAKAAGFEVEVRGVWWDEELAKEDLQLAESIGLRFQPVMDLRSGAASGWIQRLKQRVARELFQRAGIPTARSFGIAAPEMLLEALRLKPDVTMVHSEAGLWAAKRLLGRGFRVGVDFEDWFSEDLPEADRKGRPVAALKELERHLLHHAHLTLATTHAMAHALARDAGCERLPLAIPNSFPFAGAPQPGLPAADSRAPEALSFYWFSQTIGPGRGLESVAKALPGLRGEWQLHLRGQLRGYDRWFEKHFPPTIRDRVILRPTVPNGDLARHSASHDVGLALEVPYCLNKELTASNKIFEYLRCGLAVIATDTRGQREVMEKCPDAGWIVPPDDAGALGDAMQRCLDRRDELVAARGAAREGGKAWAWEDYSGRLVKALQDAAGRK